jgi:hypothetical protein
MNRKKLKKRYDEIFKKDPLAANVFLLLTELADEKGQVRFGPNPEEEIQKLMVARFKDPRAYQLERKGSQ